MSIDAIGLFVYIVVLRFHIAYDMSIKLSAILIGLGSVILLTLIRYISAISLNLPTDQLIVPMDVFVGITQTITAFFILNILQKKDGDDLTSWFMTSAVGALINYALIPYIAPMLYGVFV